jgi:hypothetical protein
LARKEAVFGGQIVFGPVRSFLYLLKPFWAFKKLFWW